jgi:hypothetical protein
MTTVTPNSHFVENQSKPILSDVISGSKQVKEKTRNKESQRQVGTSATDGHDL